MFNANTTSLEKKVVVVNSYTHEAAATFATQAIAMGEIGRPGWEWIGWSKSPQGWKKLNVDDSLNVVIPSAGAGGALRNENGDWEDGFTARLGSSKIEEADLGFFYEG